MKIAKILATAKDHLSERDSELASGFVANKEYEKFLDLVESELIKEIRTNNMIGGESDRTCALRMIVSDLSVFIVKINGV